MTGRRGLTGAAWLALGVGIANPANAQQATQPRPVAETETQVSDIVVTGTRYRGEVASGGARIDVPIKDLPLSISVVTEELAKDRQVRNIRELADNVAGVRSRAQGSGAFSVDFTIRGLQGGNGSVVAVNGFRFENFAGGFDPQAIERVEFLKGPASVLYGASGALSGLVNIVTKTPKSDNFLIVDLTGGDPTYGRATIDGNVKLSDTLDSRTNLAITHDTVINAFRPINAQFAMQSFRWHPGDVSILAEGSYFHSNGPTREATSYPSLQRFFDLPKDFKIGEKWDRDINTGYTGRIDASWKVTPNLTLRQGVSLQRYEVDSHGVANYTADTFETLLGPDLLGRSLRVDRSSVRYLVSQSEARWNFDLGPTKHKLLIGYEYGNERFGGNCCDRALFTPIDLNNPVYGTPEPAAPSVGFFENRIKSNALYVQDFVEWGQFKLLAGLRHDDTESSSGYCDLTTPGCPDDPVVANLGVSRKKALSPRLGLAWQPTERTTVFVSWSKSFNPNTSLDRNNQVLPPERGIQYEAGFRQDLAKPGQLVLTGSVYRLARRNIADCDPTFPDCSRSVAIGEQVVKGAELELAGKPIDWIDVVATYSYIHGRVTDSGPTSGIAVGSQLAEAVPHSASLFAKFALDPLDLPKVAVSAGVYYLSKRPGREYTFPTTSPFSATVRDLPASTRIDVGAFWDVSDRFRLQMNVTNLFDAKVYEPVNSGFIRSPIRRVTLGVRVTI